MEGDINIAIKIPLPISKAFLILTSSEFQQYMLHSIVRNTSPFPQRTFTEKSQGKTRQSLHQLSDNFKSFHWRSMLDTESVANWTNSGDKSVLAKITSSNYCLTEKYGR